MTNHASRQAIAIAITITAGIAFAPHALALVIVPSPGEVAYSAWYQQANALSAQLQAGTAGYGALAVAVIGPCDGTAGGNCTTVDGPRNPFQVATSGGLGITSVSASLDSTTYGSAGATANVPTGSGTSVAIGTLTATASTTGTASPYGLANGGAGAAAASWNTLTFSGASPGQTATVSMTLTFTSSLPNAEGYACLAVDSICDVVSLTAGSTQTLSESVSLSSPVSIFSAIGTGVEAYQGASSATIDPEVVISGLPAGVTYSLASQNAPVPLPGGLVLFGSSLLLLAAGRRLRGVGQA